MTEPLPIEPDELLREVAWVRGLARSLLLDADEADDAAQQAWLVALSRDARARRDPRAWMAGTLRNVVRRRHREAGRRERRERAAARPEAVPSVADVVARAELHRLLVSAVLDLEEPYRSTVLKRYVEDLSAEDIARAEGVPGATVRSRLRRALQTLRGRLERELGTEGRSWSLALAPLAAAASRARPAVAAPAASAATLAGALTMSIQAKIAVVSVVAVLALGTLWMAGARARPGPGDEVSRLREVPDLSSPASVVVALPPPGDARRMDAATPEPGSGTGAGDAAAADVPAMGRLVVHVTNAAAEPLSGATVYLDSDVTHVVATDEDGVAVFEVVPGKEVAACARRADLRFATGTVLTAEDAATATTLTLVLEPGLTACVRVETEDGAPVEGASVEFRETSSPGVGVLGLAVQGPEMRQVMIDREFFRGQLDETRVSGRDGSCCISGVRAGPVAVSVVAPGFVRAEVFDRVVPAAGGELGVVTLRRGREVAGIVLDAEGAVPDAIVEAHVSAHAYIHVPTDAEGRFVLTGVEPGLTRLDVRARHVTRGDFIAKVPIVPAGLTLVLQPYHHATLRVMDAATRVPLHTPCSVTPLMPRQLGLSILPMTERIDVTPRDGLVTFDPVRPFCLGLRIEAQGYGRVDVDMARIVAAGGETIDVSLEPLPVIRVRAVDAVTGRPVPGGRVAVVWRQGDPAGPPSWRIVDARYDEIAGAYLVEPGVFDALPGHYESLSILVDGYGWSEEVPAIANGTRLAVPLTEVRLQRGDEH